LQEKGEHGARKNEFLDACSLSLARSLAFARLDNPVHGWTMDTPFPAPPVPTGRGRADFAALGKIWHTMVAGESDPVARMTTAAALIYQSDDRINWAGFYRADAATGGLVIGPYQGAPGCLRIAAGRGVCGAAAASGQTQLVPDVHAFPGHIACDSRSRSELVIPIFDEHGKVAAVLDIDSHLPDAFTEDDARALEGWFEDGVL
jgi:GAF domain-containing protein